MSSARQFKIQNLKFKIVLPCFLFLCSYFCTAQNNSAFIHQKSKLLLPSVKENNTVNLSLSLLKHEAFFCKMEDRVHNKLNIWITLRAGNDDIYRKLIESP